MKTITLILLAAFAISCEPRFQVYTSVFEPTPTIYCLVNPSDTVHYVRVGRSFNGLENPSDIGQISDSIYFDEAEVEVRLIDSKEDTLIIYAELDDNIQKESGFFTTENHAVYRFVEPLAINKFPLFKEIEVQVRIESLPVASGKSTFLSRPTIRFPYVAQQYLYMDSIRPILVQWYGGDWNEVDITFTVMEQYRDSIVTQSVSFEEKTEVVMVEDVVQVTFPYEFVVTNLDRLLDQRKQLVRRYFGPIYVTINSGNKDFTNYMKYKDGLNDFTGQTYSNFQNANGMIACKWTFQVRPLVFDYFTRQKLAADPRLTKYKFIEY